jgi:NitT/TauT family transport system substrate-binding protein
MLSTCSLLVALLAASPAMAAQSFTVSQYGIVPATLPWAIAKEKDLFKQNGLDIGNLVGAHGGGTAVRNMMAADIPFAELSTAAAISGLRSGLKLKIVYGAVKNMGETSWVVLPDSALKTVDDLKGKKVGFNNPRSATEQVLRLVLKKHALLSGVNLISTGGQAAGLTILRQKAIDATVASEPVLTVQADRYRVLFHVTDEIPHLVWSIGVTTAEFADKNPDMLRRLILTRRQAVDYIREHPDEAAKVYAKIWQFDEPLAGKILHKQLTLNYLSRGEIDRQGLDVVLEGMRLTGQLKESVDIAAAIDTRFLPTDLPK